MSLSKTVKGAIVQRQSLMSTSAKTVSFFTLISASDQHAAVTFDGQTRVREQFLLVNFQQGMMIVLQPQLCN